MVPIETSRVDPSNADQAQAWDGDEGEFWATHWERFEQSLAGYNQHLFEAADIGASANVLDVGCGTGDTTLTAARLAVDGEALGIDLSSQMIEVARQQAVRAGIANALFEQADAQIHPFAEKSIDVVISRTGTMFFGDPAAAFGNLARALRPGGQMALLVWQALPRNEWILAISSALAAGRDLPLPPPEAPGPFSMGDPDRVRNLLGGAGFAAPRFKSLQEPMYFGREAEDAYQFVAEMLHWMLDGLDERGRAQALGDLRTTIEEHESGQGVVYDSAAWLITARRL